jgi:hypothetical protein
MFDRKQWQLQQLDGLRQLKELLGKRYEVNFLLVSPGVDMGRIEMVDTPRRPHAIFDPSSKTYDIWTWGLKHPVLKRSGLTAEDAADVLATEYFIAKAKRIRKRRPDLSMREIIESLRQGYQRPHQEGKPPKEGHA